MQVVPSPNNKETKRLYCLLATSLVSLFFIAIVLTSRLSSSLALFGGVLNPNSRQVPFAPKLLLDPNPRIPSPPSIAYFITGSNGDSDRIFRLLLAVYHPKNQYLLHLDRSAPQEQRERLAVSVQSVAVFRAAQNVNVVGKADFVNNRGSTAIASTLHGAAILLRCGGDWDWFVNLAASDYPLVTQDDLLHVLSYLPRDLNFVHHTGHIGWRESRRIKPIIVDPGLYLASKSEVFYATQKREMPNAYKFFTGSPSVILSRKFVEFCIVGSDNLPRTVLMYHANMPYPHENYFQTVVCNSRQFNKTTVNHNLHYVQWDKPPKRELRTIGLDGIENAVKSGAAFGKQFASESPVLDWIDWEILHRDRGNIAPGGWCLGKGEDTCQFWGDADILKPGLGAKRLEGFLVKLLANETLRSDRCIFE